MEENTDGLFWWFQLEFVFFKFQKLVFKKHKQNDFGRVGEGKLRFETGKWIVFGVDAVS